MAASRESVSALPPLLSRDLYLLLHLSCRLPRGQETKEEKNRKTLEKNRKTLVIQPSHGPLWVLPMGEYVSEMRFFLKKNYLKDVFSNEKEKKGEVFRRL